MKKYNLYLHLGFPRTGSKTLQFHLFPLHKQINYIGRFPRKKETHLKFINQLISYSNSEFEEKKQSILAEFNNIKFFEDKINLISDEFIILNQCIYNYEATVERTIKRLYEICDDKNVGLKIFFNIRNQKDIISSLYYATNPEFENSLKFTSIELIDYIKLKKKNSHIFNFLEVFNYDKIINKIEKIIGEENLKIFIYEELKDNKKLYIKNLSNYLNIDPLEAEELLKNKHEHKKEEYINEETSINSQFNIIKVKFIKNFVKFKLNPMRIKQYFKNLIRILKTKSKLSSSEKKDRKELLKKSIELISQNDLTIKNFFKNSNKNLSSKVNLNNQSKYFF
tara:strand:- start:6681 stop:7694 length:1014 start_codon:yes stop_codon:yes gene_type:complete